MGKRGIASISAVLVSAGLFLMSTAGLAAEAPQKPKIAPTCRQCHKPDENILRGTFTSVSNKASAIQLQVGPATWLVTYDDDTKLIGAEKWSKIPKEKEIAVAITRKEGLLYATSLTVKPPIKVPEDKLLKVNEIAKLAAAGPEKGNFTLVDSRPAARFSEGHIPGAVNLSYAEFDKLKNRLPKEKDKLLVFYCAGPTCRLSTSSARKAEQEGYKNVKVFLDGMPAWKGAGNLVLSSAGYIKEIMDKDIPAVLVDVRLVDEAKRDHIPNAVSIPAKEIAHAKDRFPDEKSAPVILYANDTKAAADVFKTVRGWGYSNTTVLEGGIEAWKKTGGLVVNGDITSKIVYVPKLRPGEISIEEFKRIAETLPSDKLIVDVRDEDEAMQGMLKGALNIPAGDLRDRLKEIPKDKELITHCATGVRGEMAYHILKEAGYKVRFLNATIKIDKDGKYTITKE